MSGQEQEVQLSELAGTRVLDGINRGPSHTDDANVVLLRLNGVTYEFSEDPNDGYRSMLGGVRVVTDPVVPFEPVIVSIEHIDNASTKMLVLRRALGKRNEICRVGTDNYDDYYPCFVFDWQPDNDVPDMPS
jgi:hypothetical protein